MSPGICMSRTPRLVRRATIAGALGVAAAALALPSSPADAVGVGSYAFATQLSFSDPSSLAIVNAADGSVAATVQVGNGAFSTAVSADGQRAYVANYDDGTVSVVDAGQEKVVDTVALPAGSGPNDVALSPDGSRLYVADYNLSQVDVVDTAGDDLVDTVDVGPNPWSVVASATDVYTADSGGHTVTVVDAATNQVATSITVAGNLNPAQLALVPGAHLLYVGGQSQNGVTVVDTATNTVLRTLPDIEGTTDLAVSPDGSRTYVTTSLGTLDVLDSASSTVLATVTDTQLGVPGDVLNAVGVGSDGRVYVGALSAPGSILVSVDPTTFSAVTTTSLPDRVVGVTTGTIAPVTSGKADVQASLAGPRTGTRNTSYTYTESVRNAGPGAASKVVACFVLPPGASLVSASGSYVRVGRLVVWRTVPTLAANASSSYTVRVRFADKGTKVLAGAAGSLSTRDPKLGNNLAAVTTRVS